MTPPSDAQQRVLEALDEAGEPVRSSDLAAAIGEPIADVLLALHEAHAGSAVWLDVRYRWCRRRGEETPAEPVEPESQGPADPEPAGAGAQSGARLDNLISYYLDCLQEDNVHGARNFLTDEGEKYLSLPLQAEWSLQPGSITLDLRQDSSIFARQLGQRGGNAALFYGYPLWVEWVRGRRGWSGGFAIPAFFQPAEFTLSGGRLTAQQVSEWPRPNEEFMGRAFDSAESRRSFLQTLGLLDPAGDAPEGGIADVVARMKQFEVPGIEVESLDPRSLGRQPRVQGIREGGFFNRALLVPGERPKYTEGLETELKQLRDQVQNASRPSAALSLFFGRSGGPADRENVKDKPIELVESVPLNPRQADAVRSAFTRPLTVVTGPPGTGKSQVVLSILANAYLNDQSVLFTSRNNKAVDVVEDRANDLTRQPILFRLGAYAGERNLRSELARALTSALSSTIGEEDRRALAHAESSLSDAKADEERLWAQVEELRKARNQADALDRDLQAACDTARADWLQVREHKSKLAIASLERARTALRRQNPECGFLTRLSARMRRGADARALSAFAREAASLPEGTRLILRTIPDSRIGEECFDDWRPVLERVDWLQGAIDLNRKLDLALQKLGPAEAFERLTCELRAAAERTTDCAQAMVLAKSNLLPDRLTDDRRREVAEYRASIEALADGSFTQESRRAWNRMRELFRHVLKLTPLWCVTNLSARGSLPFVPELFDLLVIDEASQCDIPSALPLIFRAKRVVVIGDPFQLRHITKISNESERQLQRRYGLESQQVYTFSRNSLFDLALASDASPAVVTLEEHFRSHRDIVEFSNRYWYGGRLEIATDYRRLVGTADQPPGVQWTDVRSQVSRPGQGGAISPDEAEAVAREVEDLLVQRGFEGTVGVVTPFRAQVTRIRDVLSQRIDQRLHEHAKLIVDTAHGFQGDERDVVIFSPCVGSRMPRGADYFLRSTGNLFNVAITRARTLLHVVGDLRACGASDIAHIREFARYCEGLRVAERPTRPGPPPANDPYVGPWERPFYDALVAAGLEPFSQHAFEQYRLDFALFNGEVRVDVEVDGELYHRDWDGRRCRRDIIRDQRLIARGWRVKRFWVYQIRDDLEGCVRSVEEAVNRMP